MQKLNLHSGFVSVHRRQKEPCTTKEAYEYISPELRRTAPNSDGSNSARHGSSSPHTRMSQWIID